MARFLGVDGCRLGWFAAWQDQDQLCGELYASAECLWAAHPDAESIMIDIPIGLKDTSPRQLEATVRQFLGPRKSSVFPVPTHQAAYAESYEAAAAINRQQIGKGLSKQAWFICPRIRDVDQLLQSSPESRRIFGECHPELAFARLNGAPLPDSKKTEQGKVHRREIVRQYFSDCDDFIETMLQRFPRRDLQLDDCLDALALTVTAAKKCTLEAEPECGVGGISICMWVPDY